MGLIDRLFGDQIARKAQEMAVKAGYPQFMLDSAQLRRFEIPGLELPKAQARMYQKLSWVANAVSRVAASGAATDLMVKTVDGEKTEDVINHPLEKLFFQPNPRRGRFSFFEASFSYFQLTGNNYWWLNKTSENAKPTEIFCLPSHQVEPVPDGRMYLKGYLYDPGNGQKIPLEEWEVVQFRMFNPFSPYLGLSPIEALANVAIGDLKMQEWNTNFFGKNNAKMPGALTFADPIPDSDWEKMKGDFKEQHGDTKRSLMMLRGVGQGGVNWIQTSMSQSDMEFLNGRDFNKKEIYDTFAPGYYSWTSENATEANARAGRDAFFELAIYPLLQAYQETITNKILPHYGENLRAVFEDVRPKNVELEMEQIKAYSMYHTVDEVRQKYYNSEPLNDERGNIIVSQRSQQQVNVIDQKKDDERSKFHKYAQKRIEEGKRDKIDQFTFDYLDLDEQSALKAQYGSLDGKLTEIIDVLRGMDA